MDSVSPFKLKLAGSVGALSRSSGRGGGTSLPGKVLLRLQDDAIARLSSQLDKGSLVISATNGKTTTASLLASILKTAGIRAVHNHTGANMAGGIATALLDATSDGNVRGDIGLFEVDEAWTTEIVAQTHPRVVVLANLFRDQLDRYGELETLADEWREMIVSLPEETCVVINADDPLLAGLAADRKNVIFFGIDDESQAEATPRHAADSKFCRNCGAPLAYSAVQLGHLGKYSCPNCDFERPTPVITVTKIDARGMAGSTIEIATPAGSVRCELPIPGLYNVYNAAAAAATAYALGIDASAVAGGLSSAKAVFGRVETLSVAGQEVALLLIKNPTGANEVLRTITEDAEQFDLWIALNDNIADGRDVSWVWDADFEMLAGRIRMATCSGTRAEEMALRLAYAGVERERIRVDRELETSFDRAVSGASNSGSRLFALPTYTALLDLRNAISRRGEAPSYWSR